MAFTLTCPSQALLGLRTKPIQCQVLLKHSQSFWFHCLLITVRLLELPRWHEWSRICLPVQATAGDLGLILGSGRFPGGGDGNRLRYSCWDNPIDRGAWWATVHDVAELAVTEAAKHTSMLGFLIRSDEFLSLPILLNTHTLLWIHTFQTSSPSLWLFSPELP